MKRVILVTLFLFAVTVSFGQNKWQQKKINYFVEAAAKEYNLDPDKKAELLKARSEYIYKYMSTNNLGDEEKKEKRKELNKTFHNTLIKKTGKTYKELQPFLKRMRAELKNIK